MSIARTLAGRARYPLAGVALVWAGAAVADFEAGVEAYARGDYASAHREWAPLARAGDANAQFSLGVMYGQGLGVEADPAEAARWHRLAAEQGVVAAQFTLGLLYGQGLGVPADARQSARWYAEAARQGDADAQFALGLLYTQGAGVPRDDAQAVEWYRRAATQGLAVAQASLGLMYEGGHGVAQHDACAYAWFSLAAARGIERAAEKRDALRGRMTPEQVAEGQTLAGTLLPGGECGATAPLDHASRALVAEVQTALRALGYAPGATAGEADADTVAAVRAFQRDLGLSPTGRISEELLMLIRARAE